MKEIENHIEALIFAAAEPVSNKEIVDCLSISFNRKFQNEEVEEAMVNILEKYKNSAFPFEITEIADGFQFLTKPEYHEIIGVHIRQTTQKRLSRAALETLSVIAYKQPVSKPDIERVRGVSCDYSIQKLLEKELIHISGRGDGPGKPLIYVTSAKFMDYFGLKSIKDLPKLKDIQPEGNSIGDQEILDDEDESGLEKLKAFMDRDEEE